MASEVMVNIKRIIYLEGLVLFFLSISWLLFKTEHLKNNGNLTPNIICLFNVNIHICANGALVSALKSLIQVTFWETASALTSDAEILQMLAALNQNSGDGVEIKDRIRLYKGRNIFA